MEPRMNADDDELPDDGSLWCLGVTVVVAGAILGLWTWVHVVSVVVRLVVTWAG
jgi:hypothetical protein